MTSNEQSPKERLVDDSSCDRKKFAVVDKQLEAILNEVDRTTTDEQKSEMAAKFQKDAEAGERLEAEYLSKQAVTPSPATMTVWYNDRSTCLIKAGEGFHCKVKGHQWDWDEIPFTGEAVPEDFRLVDPQSREGQSAIASLIRERPELSSCTDNVLKWTVRENSGEYCVIAPNGQRFWKNIGWQWETSFCRMTDDEHNAKGWNLVEDGDSKKEIIVAIERLYTKFLEGVPACGSDSSGGGSVSTDGNTSDASLRAMETSSASTVAVSVTSLRNDNPLPVAGGESHHVQVIDYGPMCELGKCPRGLFRLEGMLGFALGGSYYNLHSNKRIEGGYNYVVQPVTAKPVSSAPLDQSARIAELEKAYTEACESCCEYSDELKSRDTLMAHVASMAGKDWLEGQMLLAAFLNPDGATKGTIESMMKIVTGQMPTDEQIDADLAGAGIDMIESNKKLHAMIDKARAVAEAERRVIEASVAAENYVVKIGNVNSLGKHLALCRDRTEAVNALEALSAASAATNKTEVQP